MRFNPSSHLTTCSQASFSSGKWYLKGTDNLRTLLFAVALAATCAAAAAPQEAASRPKEVYAHYMACWPAVSGALPYAMGKMADDLSAEKDYCDLVGGRIVNWPLAPQHRAFTPDECAELEIRRAMRAGLDGFAIDAWAGGDGAKATLERLLAAAERLRAPFKLTICLDPSCHPKDKPTVEAFAESVRWWLGHRDSPNFAMRDGLPLIFGYSSGGIVPYAERSDPLPIEERLAHIAAGWARFRELVGEPVFLHGCLENMLPFNRDDWSREDFGEWAGGVFDAVGGFLGADGGRWGVDPRIRAGVARTRAEWSQPLWWQYDNKLGGIHSDAGTDALRRNWEAARESGSTLLQFVTWNDYGEETVLAPAYGTSYTLTRLNRHFALWWKEGKEPKPEQDELHVVFRKAPDAAWLAGTWPCGARSAKAPCVLEVVALLRKPGRVGVPGYGEWDAPAGFSFRQWEAKPGAVSARLYRRSWFTPWREVLRLDCPERVTDAPWREDFTQAAYGTNFDAEWAEDFGAGEPPLRWGDYGDIDGDGLPNWFEMLFFGRYPFLDTAAAADPAADPDGDGATNLDEFLRRTDPTRPDPEPRYEPGFAWRLADLAAAPALFNPSRDSRGAPVWRFEWRFGPAREIDLADSAGWNPCRDGGGATKRRAAFSPPRHPEFGYGAGFAFRDDGALETGGRHGCALALAWVSPVAGAVEIVAEAFASEGHGFILPTILNGGETVAQGRIGSGETATLRATLDVAPGDTIRYVADFRDAWGLKAFLRRLDITLLPAKETDTP